MAARKLRPKFYVYEVIGESNQLLYVGKGSGRRKDVSKRERGGSSCAIVAWFWKEKDAYLYEVERIKELSPLLNKHPGGNGSRAKAYRYTPDKIDREIARIGTRKYAARLAIKYINVINSLQSKIDSRYPISGGAFNKLFEVAYG